MDFAEVIERTPWIPSWHDTGNCADRRHILWIYEMLKATGLQRTLEIGSYSGCSSSAFIAAGCSDAHFADIAVSAKMRQVIGEKGTIHQRKGCDVVNELDPFDVVFVDGAHDMQSVMEEINALSAKPPKVIIAHDINSSNVGFPHCEGAAHLFDIIRISQWMFAEDILSRTGERTDRGLMMAAQDHELFRHIEATHALTCE